ncbi:MAG: sulfatase-like hydrolase/transferase [Planctomycetes bacterium]|nr:sulfatase-like hydrolase/transferase [Planctomycetota bacterium]
MKHTQTRRSFLRKIVIATAAIPMARMAHARNASVSKPNIVIVIADDLGWFDVSYHGGPIPTPRIDRFAKEGVELDHFYVCHVCSPTRAGLLTGRYPLRFGLQDAPIMYSQTRGLPPTEFTLPKMLAEAGYRHRQAVGKWHLGTSSNRFHPMNHGFTGFYGHYCGMFDCFDHSRGGQPDWHRDHKSIREEGYSTTLMTDEAVRFVTDHAKDDAPFLLYLAYNAVHTPIQAPKEDIAAAEAPYLKAVAKYGEKQKKQKKGEKDKPYWGQGLERSQDFFAMTMAMDRAFGRVLDSLEKNGIRDNTIVWFTSDNGGTSNNYPLRGRKGDKWDGGVRVPAAVRWPNGFSGGRKLTEMLAYIDIWPTLKRIAGYKGPVPKQIDGIDVLDILASRKASPDRIVYLGKAAATTRRWKLSGKELYDLDSDPREKTDVAAKHPEIVQRLTKELGRFEALSGPACMPVGKERQKPHVNWDMPDLEVDDPDAP